MRKPPAAGRSPRHDNEPARRSGPRDARPPGNFLGLPNPSVARPALLYGIHAVGAAWQNPERRCAHLYGTASALAALLPSLEAARAAGLKRPEPIVAEGPQIDRLLPAGSVHQGLALDAESLPEIGLEDVLIARGDGPATLVLLDQVTDPHNVGAVLRSAAAFGAAGLIVQRRHAPEMSGVLAKAASGAAEIVPILRETNLARAVALLREAGFLVVALDETADIALSEIAFSDRTVLALGAEGAGLRRLVAEGCDLRVRLPTLPPIASLNVSNAAAVGLYALACRSAALRG